MSDYIETSLLPKDEIVEVMPYGLAAGPAYTRPVMLFKEKNGKEIFPVWLSPLDAGIAATQHNAKTPTISPHDLTSNIIHALGVRVTKCIFIEIKGNQQFVDLYFEGSDRLSEMRTRADQCISFCLHERSKFFSSRGFIQDSRDQEAEFVGLSKGLSLFNEVMENPHPYLM